MTPTRSALLDAWRRYGTTAPGRWFVSRMVAFKAPYFRTIRPTFTRVEPGRVEASMPMRWSITNHLGSVHAIAMCNLAELVGGCCTDVSVPGDLRWIPVGMTVRYLKIARTDLRAVATLPGAVFEAPGEVIAHVEVHDREGVLVFTADITMRLSTRAAK
jgi:acyl-coenzyme A thioesterase PaaI-like protein